MNSETYGELNLSDDDNDDTAKEDNSSEIYNDQTEGYQLQSEIVESTEKTSTVVNKNTSLKRKAESTSNEKHAEQYQKLNDNTRLVVTHYNKLEEKGFAKRSKSKILYMRNFNNWIKSILIDEYLEKIKSSLKLGEPLRVLDMCCGKGGDLFKWEKGGITHLICTDIADVSVEQCQHRYNLIMARSDKNKFGTKKFTVEFFACDSTFVRLREKYKDPSMKLNLVSCQFAFHYCFESLTQAETMVRNAGECLLPGGYFIATIPDANEIMRRQREYGRNFGNDLYNIEFICDAERPPLFGAKYKFHLEDVVDCPEFLVHFPTFEKLCKKNGLKLVMKYSFADYYKANVEKGKGLLQKMQALETYSAPRHTSSIPDDEEFSHCKKHFESSKNKTVGTLSKSEWEITTLYLVCAFKKCKNTWDVKGKPVFEWD